MSAEIPRNLGEMQAYRKEEARVLRVARKTGLAIEAQEYLSLLKEDLLYQQARETVIFDRWERLAERVPKFSEEDWEKAGKVIPGLNNGVKAGLFLEIAKSTKPGTYLSVEDIVDRFKNLFAGTELLKAFSKHNGTGINVVSYCRNSLCGVGLLTAELNLEGKPIGFGVTQEGLDYGIDAALLTLQLENKTGQSLFAVLGQTASSSPGDVRSPFSRAKILDYLARHPHAVREADVMSALELTHSITDSLELFFRLGLIKYKVVNLHTDKIPFKFERVQDKNLGDAPYVEGLHVLQKYIVEVINASLASQARFCINDIVERLPEDVRSKRSSNGLRLDISRIISYLVLEGYLGRVDGFKGSEKHSDISLTKKGRELVADYIWPVLFAVSGRILTDRQKEALRQIEDNLPLMARNSAELYYPYSNSSKKREHEQNMARLRDLLLTGTVYTNSDIANILGLNKETILTFLRPEIAGSDKVVLEVGKEAYIVNRKRVKGIWYYRI